MRRPRRCLTGAVRIGRRRPVAESRPQYKAREPAATARAATKDKEVTREPCRPAAANPRQANPHGPVRRTPGSLRPKRVRTPEWPRHIAHNHPRRPPFPRKAPLHASGRSPASLRGGLNTRRLRRWRLRSAGRQRAAATHAQPQTGPTVSTHRAHRLGRAAADRTANESDDLTDGKAQTRTHARARSHTARPSRPCPACRRFPIIPPHQRQGNPQRAFLSKNVAAPGIVAPRDVTAVPRRDG